MPRHITIDLATYLLQSKTDSNIPHCPNLQSFFRDLENNLKDLDRQGDKLEFIKISKDNSKKIRQKILKYLMVRRTRTQILKRYVDDLAKQKITFPIVEKPEAIFYEFNDKEDQIFSKTLNAIQKELTYIRYIPLSLHKKEPDGKEKTQQNNMKGFMQTLLFKRLESSIEAFKNTIERFIISYENYIINYHKGKVYVSKKHSQKIFEFLENDRVDEIEKLIEDGFAEEYKSSDFKEDFIVKLQDDLEILKQIRHNWSSINRDPKLIAFKEKLANEKPFQSGKSIIFTESQETAHYLYNHLKSYFNNRIISFAGSDKAEKRQIILENFDDTSENRKDDYDILITTDVLAEGVNLHRANVVVNYDLPWNPAKMMQRVGRINRINTTFDKIYTYNFFPTKQSNDIIKLKESAKSKIASFNSLLGNDSQLLTTDEEVKSHNLDGSILYDQFMRNPQNEEDEYNIKEDEYRQIIKNIEKDKPQLFEKIKKLPKKSRCSRSNDGNESKLISFIKKGRSQKFYLVDEFKNIVPSELDFLETAEYLKANPNEPISKFDEKFYQFLKTNKDYFAKETQASKQSQGNRSNNQPEVKLQNKIKFVLKDLTALNDQQTDYLESLSEALQQNLIPKKICSKILNQIAKSDNIILNPHKFLSLLQDNIANNLLNKHQSQNKDSNQDKIEVILSCFFNKN